MDTSPHTSGFVNVADIHGQNVRLHYLDWGGAGPVLLFIPGMGCTAHIFDGFALRFRDHFHVLALTRRGHGESDYPEQGYDPDTLAEDLRQFLDARNIDKVILAGHSMGYVELSRFAVLYPERVIKLVWLDAAFDRTSPDFQVMLAENPLPKIIPPWPSEPFASVEDYAAKVKWLYPSLAAIWGPELEADLRANVTTNAEGGVVDKMSDAINAALNNIMKTYPVDYASIHAPGLYFFVLPNAQYFISSDYMTAEQQAQVLDYLDHARLTYNREYIEQFRRSVPNARVIVIPNGHHYCFIQQETLVYNEMRAFLLED